MLGARGATPRFVLAIAAIWCVLPLADARASGAAAEIGKGIAESACSTCHQVQAGVEASTPLLDEDNKRRGDAASFSTIAAEYRGDPVRLRFALSHAHYPMPEPQIGGEELDPLVDYILALRPSPQDRP